MQDRDSLQGVALEGIAIIRMTDLVIELAGQKCLVLKVTLIETTPWKRGQDNAKIE